MRNVKELRTTLGLSRAAFAKEIGFLPQTVQAWEEGKKTPGPRARSAIAYLAEKSMINSKIWPLKQALEHFDMSDLSAKELKLIHKALEDRYYAAWREIDKRRRKREAEQYEHDKRTMQIYGG